MAILDPDGVVRQTRREAITRLSDASNYCVAARGKRRWGSNRSAPFHGGRGFARDFTILSTARHGSRALLALDSPIFCRRHCFIRCDALFESAQVEHYASH